MPHAFSLGRIVITQHAARRLPEADVLAAICRHARADWGDVCPDDRVASDCALAFGDQLLSVYHTADRTKFWIITEWDRSVTTILLPEDY